MQAKDLVGQNVRLVIYFWQGSALVEGPVVLVPRADAVRIGDTDVLSPKREAGTVYLPCDARVTETSPGKYAHHATTAQSQAQREEVRS